MKNELQHIDKIFLDAATDDASEFSTKKGWRILKIKLLLSEIMTLNFVNINWAYLIYPGIFLLMISFYLVYFDTKTDEHEEMNATVFTNLPQHLEEPGGFNNNNPSLTETKQATYSKPGRIADTENPVLTDRNKQSYSGGMQQQNITVTNPKGIQHPDTGNKNDAIKPKLLIAVLGIEGETSATNHASFRLTETTKASSVSDQVKENGSVHNFMLGLNAGLVFPLNQSSSTESMRQPVWLSGINFRYSRNYFFIETAIELCYYESFLNSSYRYDSLLGIITSSGYEIIETINDEGETVLERQYTSNLTPVYDTLSSDDFVTINANSTVLCIPVRVGTTVFRSRNFYTAVFAGVAFKLLLNKNQSLPQFDADNRRIIEYETNPAINYNPEIYFQAGLLLGYDISKSFSLEVKSSYNHILGGNSTLLQSSKANIQAGFGLNFKF